MDVEHEVLQVGVHTRLGVDRSLLVRQQVVELHDADRDRLILLRLEHHLLQRCVLDDLIGNDRGEVARLSHVPPVVAVERSIQVVAQALKTKQVSIGVKEQSKFDDLPLGSGRVFVLQAPRLRG